MTRAEAADLKPTGKFLAAPRVKVRLAIASSVIVAAGALLAPRASDTGLSAPPQEHAAPLLEEQVLPREIVRPFRGVQDIADRVRHHTVAITPAWQQVPRMGSDSSTLSDSAGAAGFGVLISNTHVLTHAAALDGRSSVQVSVSDGALVDARMAAYESETGLVVLQLTSSQLPVIRPANLAGDRQPTGTLAAAVGRWRGTDISVPVFVTSAGADRYTLSGLHSSHGSGMPVFTMDGALFAVAAGIDGEGRAFPVREAADRLIARANTGERLVGFGVTFQELDGLLTRVVAERGVLINSVVARGPAGEAGVMVGDTLVGIGGAEIDSVDAAVQALRSTRPGQVTTLRILRGGRARTVTVTPATAYEVAAMARANPRTPDSAPEARALFPLPLLEDARIPASARVASINGQAVSSGAQAQRLLRNARRPVLLLLRYADHQFFAAIERAR